MPEVAEIESKEKKFNTHWLLGHGFKYLDSSALPQEERARREGWLREMAKKVESNHGLNKKDAKDLLSRLTVLMTSSAATDEWKQKVINFILSK